MIFYKSAAAAAAATPQNQKRQKIGVAYVVRSLCFNFEQNRTISTMPTSSPAKITLLSPPPKFVLNSRVIPFNLKYVENTLKKFLSLLIFIVKVYVRISALPHT